MGLNVVNDTSTSEGRGIFVIVEMACSNGRDIKIYKKVFWLPKGLVRAVLSLRDAIHVNRLENIPDEKCTKAVTFKIKNAEPTVAFYRIIKTLNEIGVMVRIENAPKQIAEELKKLNVEVV
jgi:hypothetical protein